jgi:hypothetical protein
MLGLSLRATSRLSASSSKYAISSRTPLVHLRTPIRAGPILSRYNSSSRPPPPPRSDHSAHTKTEDQSTSRELSCLHDCNRADG